MNEWFDWEYDELEPTLYMLDYSDEFAENYCVFPQPKPELYATRIEVIPVGLKPDSEITVFAIQWLLERGWTVGRHA